MLGLPYIKFIYILSFLNKINKKILCFIVEKKLFIIKGVNQQETLLSNLLGEGEAPLRGALRHPQPQGGACAPGYNTSPSGLCLEGTSLSQASYSNSKGSSETTCDITYNFEEYSNLIPKQKKKIKKNFLE